MKDLNKVQIIGRLTKHPELKEVGSGMKLLNLSIATNRSWKKDDKWLEEVEFHNITVWGDSAEYLSTSAEKGSRVYVEGRLKTESWEDKETKKKVYKATIVLEKYILLDKKEAAPADVSIDEIPF